MPTVSEGNESRDAGSLADAAVQQDLTAESPSDRWRIRILIAAIIVLAGLWIYSPSYHGEWLWDDDQLLLADPVVQHRMSSDPKAPTDHWATLRQLWFKPRGADYFPLFTTALWAQWSFFRMDSTGYHATTILLHIAGALLLWALLAKMKIPGAWLAGLVFAIHPVCVSSVAWVSETKNTLSLPLFLVACLCWVGQDDEADPRKRQRLYALSIVFFLLATLAKTSVVAFPVVTLLHAWWKRGKIVRADVLRALPLLVISIALGLVTISYQWSRAIGPETTPLAGVFTVDGFLSRAAIAGTGVIHYLTSIIWPLNLVPIYPRLAVDPPQWWMFLAWPVILGGAWLMWRNRGAAFPPRWGRHALFAFGFFLLMLAPVLGFVDISYMRVAWVADHFIYVPMIGILAFLCAGAVLFFDRLPDVAKPRYLVAGSLVLAAIAFLAFRYTNVWGSEDSLWKYTLKHNYDSWMAHNRLGARKSARGDLDGAHEHFLNAVRLRPNLGETQNNLGSSYLTRAQIFRKQGDQEAADQETAAAIGHFTEACRWSPHVPIFHINLANALTTVGRYKQAGEKYKEILGWDPNNAAMVQNYGIALFQQGRVDESIVQFRRALEIAPDLKDASDSLAMALAKKSEMAKQPRQKSRSKSPVPRIR